MTKIGQLFKNIPKWCAPALILILGAVLRIVCLESMPGGMHQDESFVAWNAYALWQEGMDSAGHMWPVYMADWGDGHSALYVWLTIPFVALNAGHVTAFWSRLPQALVAIATLGAIYGILKRLLNRNAALWGMFVLAVCPWHIMMSRWGLDANLAPGFLIFGLYFLVRSLEKEQFLIPAAVFYGLCLYCYAICWLVVPLVLGLAVFYGLWHRKLRISKWSLSATGILLIMALPLILFVMVNQGLIPEIKTSFMTIPAMGGYRGDEIAVTPGGLVKNLRTALSLLWNQNTGAPYDILLPWGLFYDIGRVFAVWGAICLVIRVVKGVLRRTYTPETFLFIQLFGGGVVCLMVTAVLHQINALYIPIVICEVYGIWVLVNGLTKYKRVLGQCAGVIIALVYCVCLVGFQRDYYGDYRQVVNAYFAEGLQECVEYAQQVCEEKKLHTITVEKGAQWPRLLLYTETLPSAYLSSVEYDVAPAPASFISGDLLIRTRIDYENLSKDSVYIIYFIDEETFAKDYDLHKFNDWYVAVPK